LPSRSTRLVDIELCPSQVHTALKGVPSASEGNIVQKVEYVLAALHRQQALITEELVPSDVEVRQTVRLRGLRHAWNS